MAKTIEALLASLDLGKYDAKFKEEEIDLAAAKKLTEDDLKELGLAMGARKKLYAALHGEGAGAAAPPTPGPSPSPAAATASAASAPPLSPSKAAASVSIKNNFSWRWQFDSQPWPDYVGPGTEHFRLEDGPEPTRLLVSSRNTPDVQIYDVSSGRRMVMFSAPCGSRIFDADWLGDVIVSCGGDSDAVVYTYSVSDQKQTGHYHGPNEGGLHDVAVYVGPSGSVQAATAQYNGNVLRLWDVATAARAGKITGAYEGIPRALQRDPIHQGCFLVADLSGKLSYIDSRAGKRVKLILGLSYGANTVRFPATSNGRFVATDGSDFVKVFDLGTGGIVHTIKGPVSHNNPPNCAAMYANVVVLHAYGQYHFYDLDGAPKEITESIHDLRGQQSQDLDMSSRLVVGLCQKFFSIERPEA